MGYGVGGLKAGAHRTLPYARSLIQADGVQSSDGLFGVVGGLVENGDDVGAGFGRWR